MRLRGLFGPDPAEDRRTHMPAAIPAAVAAVGLTGIAATIATAVLSLAASFALSFIMGKLFGPKVPRPPETKRELGQPESLPAYRFVYGHTSAFGSPAPFAEDETDDEIVWGCLIFNSRPSAGTNMTLLVDKRETVWTGDPFDFTASGGATVTGPGKLDSGAGLKFWIGLGDQTAPPAQVTTDAPQFTSGDKWRNRTVLWTRFKRGKEEDKAERWPAWPPVFELIMDWSLVWNPRDPAQSLDNPASWTFSANRSLCVLDALTQNPLRPYREANLDLDLFKAAADVDDENVALKAGGTEKRHEAHGVLVWDSREVYEQVEPLVMAGGSTDDLVRIGGRLGLIPGEAPETALTITDILDDDLEWQTLKPGRDLASRVSCSYVNADRDFQMADLPVYEVPGAVAEDGGVPTVEHLELGFVQSHAQAARLQKRHAYRLREQERIKGTLPPAAFDLVAGSGVQMTLPAPWDDLDGLYQVRRITPRLIEEDDDGVTMRCPAEVVRINADGYAWDAATEEPDIGTAPSAVSTVPLGLETPTITSVLSDDATHLDDGGGDIIARIEVIVAEPANTNDIGISKLEVRYKLSAETSWQRETTARLFGEATTIYLSPVTVGETYDIQARWVGLAKTSAWTTTTTVTVDPPSAFIPGAPFNGSATGGAGQVTVSFQIGNDDVFKGIEFYRSTTNDSATSTLVHGPIFGSPNETYGFTDTGLAATTTYYYWAKALGKYGSRSAFSTGVSATTT